MKHYYRYITDRYLFRIVTSLLLAGAVTVSIIYKDLLWIVISSLLLLTSLRWQWKLYRRHTQKVLFLLDAIENNDASIHFSEHEDIPDNHIVNQALNRVASILYNVKSETAQQEKYYELILDCINTGILVLNDAGAVYQKNNEALRLLGWKSSPMSANLAVLTQILWDFSPIAAPETSCKPACPTNAAQSTSPSASPT